MTKNSDDLHYPLHAEESTGQEDEKETVLVPLSVRKVARITKLPSEQARPVLRQQIDRRPATDVQELAVKPLEENETPEDATPSPVPIEAFDEQKALSASSPPLITSSVQAQTQARVSPDVGIYQSISRLASKVHFSTKKVSKKRKIQITLLAIIILGSIFGLTVIPGFASADGTVALLSQNRPAVASSVISVLYPPAAAVDGNAITYWASAQSPDAQWIAIDFDQPIVVDHIVLQWFTAYAKVYELQSSNDGINWTSFYQQDARVGGTETITAATTGRYIRLYNFTPSSPSAGYTLSEFDVYGVPASPSAANSPSPTLCSTDTDDNSATPIPTLSPTATPCPTATDEGSATPSPTLSPTDSTMTPGSPTPTEDTSATQTSVPTGSTGPDATVPPGLQLSWDDEFNGPSGTTPDASKWYPNVGHQGGASNGQLEYSTNNQNTAEDGQGNLVIEARQSEDDGYNYTSGHIESSQAFTYGYFEARIKIPVGQGVWPAFWLVGGNWPNDGEIDIMEGRGAQEANTIHGTVHGPNGTPDGYGIGTPVTLPTGSFGDDYHIFGAYWTKDQIVFSLDGKNYFTVKSSDVPNWVFNQPENIILNVAVGGWGGTPGSDFPQDMSVDYVRVYQ